MIYLLYKINSYNIYLNNYYIMNIKTFSFKGIEKALNNNNIDTIAKEVERYTTRISSNTFDHSYYWIPTCFTQLEYKGTNCIITIEKRNGEYYSIETEKTL